MIADSQPFRAAVVQMQAGLDRDANLSRVTQLVQRAAEMGAALVVLPEMFLCWGPLAQVAAHAEPIPGPASDALANLARELNVVLLAGSMPERSPVEGQAYNTSLLFGSDGRLLARYRKMHLFDVDLPGQVVSRESQSITPGDKLVVAPTPLGMLGLAICYDLRFPELFRALTAAGAELLCVPSAFSAPTGRDHWHVLVRARAIENQAFVLAANQCGSFSPAITTYGHSLIVDPWGRVLAEAGEEEAVLVADIDLAAQREIRRHLPALEHRRLPLPGADASD